MKRRIPLAYISYYTIRSSYEIYTALPTNISFNALKIIFIPLTNSKSIKSMYFFTFILVN